MEKKFYNDDIKKGFTLAEVLITLGIIGIVATLTMPMLVANYQKQVTVTRLKKAYSMINQAVQLSSVDNGEVSGWDFPTSRNSNTTNTFMEKYIVPYIKTTKICLSTGTYSTTCNPAINASIPFGVETYLSDGTVITWGKDGGSVYMGAFVDINGTAAPNVSGKDIFEITVQPSGVNVYQWAPGIQLVDTRENWLERCKISPNSCAGLIRYDGWQIKDDYPW